jgi:hypothetical protein
MCAAAAIAFLQSLILATGNYGFFNWLTLALCVLLLDDAVWPLWLRRRAGLVVVGGAAPQPGTPGGHRVATAVAVGLGLLGAVPLLGAMRVPGTWLGPLPYAYELVQPFRTVNPYGLFAVMTTRRLEIEVEGGDDGVHWRPYAFRWKPGDPRRRPAFVPGHMPRLDWQMWFAALEPDRPAPWFLGFARRLLSGSRPVLGLLDGDPFPERPPRLLRASLYQYRFTDAAGRRATGAWWSREYVGEYLPPVELLGGRLVLVTETAPSP